MALKPISPQAASALISQGAVLIDIRNADEYAREHIAQARRIMVDQLANGALSAETASAVIFHCLSGNRTQMNAQALSACTPCDTYVLEGGLAAWKNAGLPVLTGASGVLDLQRQVQIAAGSAILLGVVLGSTVSPWFYALSGFVGAGLVFAGISGFCGLARILAKMPWNRTA